MQDEEIRSMEIDKALSEIRLEIPEKQKAKLARRLTNAEISKALETQPNGKAPGPDSISVELYKVLYRRSKARQKKKEEGFDLV